MQHIERLYENNIVRQHCNDIETILLGNLQRSNMVIIFWQYSMLYGFTLLFTTTTFKFTMKKLSLYLTSIFSRCISTYVITIYITIKRLTFCRSYYV